MRPPLDAYGTIQYSVGCYHCPVIDGRLLTTLIGMWILHIVAYPFHSHTFSTSGSIFPNKYLQIPPPHRIMVGESSGVAVAFQKPRAEFDDNTQSCTCYYAGHAPPDLLGFTRLGKF
jgi:hypothetical protein